MPRQLANATWAAPQIALDDLAAISAMGVKWIINNRPDEEDIGQPSSISIETAARDLGLDYVHAPVSGMPGPATVHAVAAVLETDEPVLMFCRSGTRSTIAWALAMRVTGRAQPEALREAAAAAGYDLSRLPL